MVTTFQGLIPQLKNKMVNENDHQISTLKQYTKDIIEETYAPILHELKKKLSVALNKEQEHVERLERYERELEAYKKCHECHRVNVEKRDVEIQVNGLSCTQANIQAVNIPSAPVYNIRSLSTTSSSNVDTSSKQPNPSVSSKIEDVETITLDNSDDED